MNIIKRFKSFSMNEAHIDKDGNLQNFDSEFTSEDMWSEEEFIDMVEETLEGGEMPEKFYLLLTNKYKSIYRTILLRVFEHYIGYSENTSLIKDLIMYNYKDLTKKIQEWIVMYSTFGNDHFPFDYLFISLIDEKLQKIIIEKLDEHMEWEIYIDSEIYDILPKTVQKIVDDSDFFIVE